MSLISGPLTVPFPHTCPFYLSILLISRIFGHSYFTFPSHLSLIYVHLTCHSYLPLFLYLFLAPVSPICLSYLSLIIASYTRRIDIQALQASIIPTPWNKGQRRVVVDLIHVANPACHLQCSHSDWHDHDQKVITYISWQC